MNKNKSLQYYHKVVKYDKKRMEKRRQYYKEYYEKNKKISTKPKKILGIEIQYGEFLIEF